MAEDVRKAARILRTKPVGSTVTLPNAKFDYKREWRYTLERVQ